MDSHELAKAMQDTAEYLLSRPSFETPSVSHSLYLGNYWDDKERFITSVKALGTGRKEYSGSDLIYRSATPVEIWACISRDKACRKVQEKKWECGPLLTSDEEAGLVPEPIMSDNDIPF